jgi:hypothetical protein
MINATAGMLGNRERFMQDAVSHCKSSFLQNPQMEVLYELLIKVMWKLNLDQLNKGPHLQEIYSKTPDREVGKMILVEILKNGANLT